MPAVTKDATDEQDGADDEGADAVGDASEAAGVGPGAAETSGDGGSGHDAAQLPPESAPDAPFASALSQVEQKLILPARPAGGATQVVEVDVGEDGRGQGLVGIDCDDLTIVGTSAGCSDVKTGPAHTVSTSVVYVVGAEPNSRIGVTVESR